MAGGAALLLVTGAVAGNAAQAFVRRCRLGRRFGGARNGERDSEQVLVRHGYRIVGRQVTQDVSITVDGVEVQGIVRADFIVERRRQRAVVEVKTGARAPDPTYIPTRRQLLEYAVVFPGHDILLLDVQAGDIQVVAFPGLVQPAARDSLVPCLLAAFILGAVAMQAWHVANSAPAPPSSTAVKR